MDASEWLYEIDGKTFSPVSWRQLKLLADTKRLSPTDLVWRLSDPRKRPAQSLSGLFGISSQFGKEPDCAFQDLDAGPPEQILMVCDHCGFEFQVGAHFIGRQGRCPIESCGKTFVVGRQSRNAGKDGLVTGFEITKWIPPAPKPRRRRKPVLSPESADPASRCVGQTWPTFSKIFSHRWFLLGAFSAVFGILISVTLRLSLEVPDSQKSVQQRTDPPAISSEVHDRRDSTRLVLEKYCGDCHAGAKPQGGFEVASYQNEESVSQDRATWERMINLVSLGLMPPAEAPQLPSDERQELIKHVEGILSRTNCIGARDSEKVTVRRLNRFEYNNTIRDLLGIDFQPADDFPSDDVGEGFDNIADVLSLSPLLMEKYLISAENIASTAISNAAQDSPALPEPLRQLITARPMEGRSANDALRENIRRFIPKAFRRPVDGDELRVFVAIGEQALRRNESFEFAMQLSLTGILVSPQFLFRPEPEQQRVNSQNMHELTDFQLATRLSYFLWGSTPDDDLFERAARGDLHTDAVIDEQVGRMLHDWKSSSLTEGFAVQWLNLRILDECRPDPAYTQFDASIKEDLKHETKAFFEYVLRQDRSILDFLDGPYTFVNERLANFYGWTGVDGNEFQLVDLSNQPRAGLLTQGSILTLTSSPTRTSPVKRGKWILEVILDQPPPPAPPNVPELVQENSGPSTLSLRQQMEIHRANPSCATCHQTMDALGFGMECFDAIGQWRNSDHGVPLDTTGALPGGRTFRGPKELIARLRERPSDFAKSLTSKMLTYALGRRLKASDRCTVESIVNSLKSNKFKFSVLIREIVKSQPFRLRHDEERTL